MKTLAAIVLTFFICARGLAQIDSANNLPVLNKHFFIPSMNVPGPFIKSYFGMNLGFAQSSEFDNIIVEIDGEEILGLRGALVFADLNFEYQQKIKDWVAFYTMIGVTARLGTDVQSILTQGVNTVSSFRLGWMLRLLQREKHLLSGIVQLNNFEVSFMSIGEFIQDIVEDSTITSITKNVPILNGGLGLRYAYGINEYLGLQAFGEIAYGDSFERGKMDVSHRLGGSFDINLATRTNVPLGFSLYFISTSLPDIVQVTGKTASNAGIKVSYSKGQHYNIGIEFSRIHVPIPNVEESVINTGVFISSKYYFN